MDRTAMLISKLKVVFLLDVLASSILAAGDEVYGKPGGAITLSPGSLPGSLNRIVWKHGDDKAIEFEDGITTAFREFKDTTFLDTKTGEMRITELDSRFKGVYSADVNGIQATKKWTLTVLDPVSKPSIDAKCNESMCTLFCKNDATVKVQCAWRNGEEELQQSDGTFKLEKTDDKVGKAYTCNCSNPVSFAVSDQIVPFPRETPVGLIVGLLFGLPAIVIGVIALIFRKKLKGFVQTCRGKRGNADAANEGGPTDTPQNHEAVPLNQNGAVNQDGANETSQDNIIDDKDMPLKRNADHADEGGAKDTSQRNADHADEGGAKDTSQKNAAGNQDGANETSQDTRC